MLDLGGDVSATASASWSSPSCRRWLRPERDRIRKRVAEVKRDQRKLNRHLGGSVPFGFREVETPPKGAELVPVPEEQESIKHMVAMRRSGDSPRTIQAAMAADGFKLSHVSVDNIIQAQEARRGAPTAQDILLSHSRSSRSLLMPAP